jgi:hypothetical protein
MSHIGKMKHRLQFVFNKIEVDEHGEFFEKQILSPPFWARVIPINMGFKRIEADWNQIKTRQIEKIFKIVMRKNYIRDALQADLIGVAFNRRVLKLLNTLQSTEDNQWFEALVVDYGVTEKSNG